MAGAWRLLGLFRTTVFRLSLLYAALFSLVATAALVFLYWWTATELNAQTDEQLRLETDVLLSQYERQPIPVFVEGVRELNADGGRARIIFYRLYTPRDWEDAAIDASAQGSASGSKQRFASVLMGDVLKSSIGTTSAADPVRVLVTDLPGNYRLAVGRNLVGQEKLLRGTLVVVFFAVGVIFLVALTGGAFMGYGVLKRIDAVSLTAGEIMEGDLAQRLPVGGRDDEFERLSLKLNAMLERIEQLLAGMRNVTDNVAHDLRGPLTRLRNRLEVTLLEQRSKPEYRDVIETTIGDAEDLIKTFNALLSIAQAEAGVRAEDWTKQDLGTLAEEIAELYEPIAEDQGLSFDLAVEPGLKVSANRQLLAQALSNLLDNAIKYAGRGGRVELTVARAQGRPSIQVADTGPGIPLEDRERALKRFVRLDAARSTPGNGLGLSLVKAVANLHRAKLRLENNHPGLRVMLWFGV
jgi:signal transduction histidine kinase